MAAFAAARKGDKLLEMLCQDLHENFLQSKAQARCLTLREIENAVHAHPQYVAHSDLLATTDWLQTAINYLDTRMDVEIGIC